MNPGSLDTSLVFLKAVSVSVGVGSSAVAVAIPEMNVLAAYLMLGGVIGTIPPMWSALHRGLPGFLRAIISSAIIGSIIGSAVAEVTGLPYMALLAVLLAALVIPDIVARPFETIAKLWNAVRGK